MQPGDLIVKIDDVGRGRGPRRRHHAHARPGRQQREADGAPPGTRRAAKDFSLRRARVEVRSVMQQTLEPGYRLRAHHEFQRDHLR